MRILIVAPSWVGDMMMSHALYQQLKLNYPHCQIDVIAPDWCRSLLDRMPEVRQAIAMPIGHGELNLTKRYQLGVSLRRQYDMAITLPNSFKSALIPFFAKIPIRRGWRGEMRYGLLNDIHTHLSTYPMMVQRYVALAFNHQQAPSSTTCAIPRPYLRTSPSQIKQTVAKFSPETTACSVIGLCPGAEFGPAKRYPHYHYASLAEMLIEAGFQIQLFGSQKDYEVGEQIRKALPIEMMNSCTNLAGKTSLTEAIDLIANCTAIITNDSGLMHIAAALNRPLVALYGPTSPRYTPPLSDNATIIRLIEGDLIKIRHTEHTDGYHQSLIDIPPERVKDELQILLNQTANTKESQ